MKLLKKLLRKYNTTFKNYSKKDEKYCPNCKHTFYVYHKLYGSGSGAGNCPCGESWAIIN